MKTKTLRTRIKLMEDIKNAINLFGEDTQNATIVEGVFKTTEKVSFETNKYYFNDEGKVIGVKNAIVLKNGYKIIFDDECMIVYDDDYSIYSLKDFEYYNVSDLSISAYKIACK